ncbi:HAD family hydrolase [Marinimicrobium sp. ABcell2]|uniref:HAD family hydrolase n=1 Tax=Marinimicrobium sp. ABcell2 TaxID=3069751 RepID=UPI0027B747D0|nr:HAD-IA family hydrolase [Marinimicrobium sp. ABcell2]MDQ2075669.1 HAD-IA family hydrolase [Marinimicrobium sp. ABcell2]
MLFIFDWDGTLSDSTGTITQAMQQSARDLGWQPPEDHQVHNIIGLGMPEALARLFPDRTAHEHVQLRHHYAENYLAADLAQPAKLFPVVMETLTHLREQGHQLTVATGKSRRGLDRVLKAMDLDTFFHGSRCADETASKPHPLMLQELLEQFRVHQHDAVMIGDTEYDMDMGRRAEMARIAVSYGAHHIDRLRPFGPELCMDGFGELLSWHRL